MKVTSAAGISEHRRDQRAAARGIPGAVVVFALSCGMFLVSARTIQRPPAWRTFEFCQYAEIGRNLAREGAFDTRLVEPMALAYIDRHRAGPPRERWPVINRYPLPCLVVAGLFRFLGPTEMAAAWSNGLAVGLLAALTYTLARRWYGPGWAAVVGLLFLANPSFYGSFVLLGTPDIWFALIFALELLAWSRLLDSPNFQPGRSAGLGALLGLAYLTRFNVVLFGAIQIAALLARRRWREALAVTATALAVTSPMLLDNWHHFHRATVSIYSAWNLLDGIGAYRVEPWLYYQVPDLAAQVSAHASGLARKLATNLFLVVPARIWSLWNLLVLLPLAFAGTAVVRPDPTARRFLSWAAGLFVVQLVAFSALRLELEDRHSPHHGRYFFWFAAPALLLGVGLLRHLAGRSPGRRALAGVVVAVQLGVYGPSWWSEIERNRVPVNFGHDPIRRMLAEVVPGGRVIASNQPQMLAWYCGLKSVSMPADPAELDRMNRDSPTPVDYIFLDANSSWIDLDRRWGLIVLAAPGLPSPWEGHLLRAYDYVFPPERTRPLLYVLLRRRGLPASRLERDLGLSPAAEP